MYTKAQIPAQILQKSQKNSYLIKFVIQTFIFIKKKKKIINHLVFKHANYLIKTEICYIY